MCLPDPSLIASLDPEPTVRVKGYIDMFAVPDNTVALVDQEAIQHPVRTALRYALNKEAWAHLLRYDPEHRFAVLVSATADEEVWLMAWLPGQQAELHDHDQTMGAFTIVSGVLSEAVTRRNSVGRAVTELNVLYPGQSRVWGPGYIHQVSNQGQDPAVSIHVYRDGHRSMRPFQFDATDGPTPR